MSDESANRLTQRQRLQKLFHRLGSSPRKGSSEEAFFELCVILDQVENEFSGVQKSEAIPAPTMADGRMYRPLEDHVVRQPNGDILALTRGHRIEITANGSLRIINKVTRQVEFQK